MNLKFKIISVDETEQSVVVRFYTDMVPEAALVSMRDEAGKIVRCRTDVNITFTDPANRPKGDALEEFILRHAPVQFFDLKEQVADTKVDTSMDDIRQMVGVEVARPVDKIEGQFILREKAVSDTRTGR